VTQTADDVAKNTTGPGGTDPDATEQKPRAAVTAMESHAQQGQTSISDVAVNAKQTKNYSGSVTISHPAPPQSYADNSENKRLRGFFRKATRIIEHTTRINPADDDNKVLIGGMAINLR
jgi:hypothetical protein